MTTLTRRDLLHLAAGAATLAATGKTQAKDLPPWGPGIKISLQIPNSYDGDYLTFAKQMGVEYVSIGGRNTSYEYFAGHKARVEAAGLKIGNMGDSSVHNMPEVTLGLQGRDAKIEEYKRYIRNLGKAGIHYTTYAHMGNGIWSSERETTRGGAPRGPSTNQPPKATGSAKYSKGPSRTVASSRKKSSGTTGNISSSRSFPSPKRPAYGSASTPMTLRCRNSAACRVTCSARSTVT